VKEERVELGLKKKEGARKEKTGSSARKGFKRNGSLVLGNYYLSTGRRRDRQALSIEESGSQWPVGRERGPRRNQWGAIWEKER